MIFSDAWESLYIFFSSSLILFVSRWAYFGLYLLCLTTCLIGSTLIKLDQTSLRITILIHYMTLLDFHAYIEFSSCIILKTDVTSRGTVRVFRIFIVASHPFQALRRGMLSAKLFMKDDLEAWNILLAYGAYPYRAWSIHYILWCHIHLMMCIKM